MGIKHRITTNFVKIFGKPRITKLIEKQWSTSEIDGALHPTSNSPTRFEIPFEMLNLIQTRDDVEMRHMFPVRRLLSVIKNIHLSVDSLPENPVNASMQTSPEFLEELKEFAQSHGVNPLEFVKLPQDLIFQKMGVLFDNAIILAMEMSKDKIDKAASQETMNMVFGTYDDLGKAANRIAEFLREHGYAAQAVQRPYDRSGCGTDFLQRKDDCQFRRSHPPCRQHQHVMGIRIRYPAPCFAEGESGISERITGERLHLLLLPRP